MGKKNKSRQNRILKAQQRQQLSSQVIAPISAAPIIQAESTIAASVPTAVDPNNQSQFLGWELGRTAISLAIVAVLLVGAIIASHHSPFLANFGNWLVKASHLNQK